MPEPKIHAPRPVQILYQDDAYYVFNKPPGLPVVPTPHEEKTLSDVVNNQCPSKNNEGLLYPCHRLDRDTTGAIIFARGKKNQKILMEEFHQRLVKKRYLALVHGRLKERAGEIRRPVQSLDERKFNRLAGPKWALTIYQVLEQKKDYSLVEVFIKTGRSNQIRIHFSQIGHPLLGERKYAFARDYELRFRRTALHAATVTWRHPITQKIVEVQAPMPEDMRSFINTHQ